MLNALLKAWTHELAQALEMMTGQAYRVSVAPDASSAADCLWYAQELTENAGAIAVGAEEHVWLELGTRALQGAGIELVEPSEARSTWFEIVQQAISGAVRAVSSAGAAVEIRPGGAIESPPANARTFSATVTTPDGLKLGLAIATSVPAAEAAAEAPAVSRPQPPEPAVGRGGAMEVLLDVHLPISISFGQTHLRLKDVLKLTAGSVVELNRQPEEPVEVIVNDYVIARGEVVIVDGNYAVRIQEIVSRQQRLGLGESRRQ